uniref:Smoothelin domain-containing protein n=1 Tax=Anopheles farauti TaxID=69004 RepID=A0A182QK15_9DIPT
MTDIGVYERTKTVREEQASVDGSTRRKESLTKVERAKPEADVPKGGRRDSGGAGVRAPAYIRDTVSSKKDLFEKRISSSKLQVEYTTQTSQETSESGTVVRKSSLKQTPPQPEVPRPVVVDGGSKPSYMNHTVASLEHINANQRRDSLDHGVAIAHEAPVKSSGSKFGVELKRLDAGNRVAAAPAQATTTKRRVSGAGEAGQPSGAGPVIEEIFDLEALERMLESVTGYEQRRRIRAQIRVVKKQKETTGASGMTTTTTTTTTSKSVTSTHTSNMARDTNTGKRKESSPTRARNKPSTNTTVDATDAFDTHVHVEAAASSVSKQRQQESARNAATSVTSAAKVTPLASDRFGGKPTMERAPPTKDDRPIWATSNILKKASENTRTFRSSSSSTGTASASSPVGRKVVSSSSSTATTTSSSTYQQTKTASEPKTTTDCITSSYGVGPTDENGLPLFGIRALKKKTPVAPVESDTTITGTCVTETLVAENGGPVVGKRSTTHYSNEHRTGGLMAIRKTETIDASGARTEEVELLDGEDGGRTREAKVVRKGSVRELTERFIHRESSGSLTQESRTYPKAGLILRSSGQSQSSRASTPTAIDGGCSVRSGSVDEFDQEQEQDRGQVQIRTFLNDTSKVVDVRDVLQRMSNADNVTERGDTAEDQEARALLNKFLGASVLMSGVESMLSEAGSAPSTAATTKKVSKVSSTTSTTKTIKSSGAAPGSSSAKQATIENLDENWDETLLKQLLESTTNYDDRRKIRARIRQVMAEKEVQQTTTRTAARMESQDGATVTTRTTVTTKTVASSAPKPMSPFAKFRQLDKQNSLSSQSPPNEKAGIAPLLDVDDMVAMRKPDWKCVFTYVQSIYRRFKNEL